MESFPVVISDVEILVSLKSLKQENIFLKFGYALVKVDRLLPINLFKFKSA